MKDVDAETIEEANKILLPDSCKLEFLCGATNQNSVDALSNAHTFAHIQRIQNI